MLQVRTLIPIGKVLPMNVPDKTTGKTNVVMITRRPGIKMNWTTITVHETGNMESSPEGEASWVTNPNNLRQASWHYCLSAKKVVQIIPDDEMAYHSANLNGNSTSLGLEICDSGDFEANIKAAAKWIAEKLQTKGLGIEAVTTHQRWSGKNCPWRLIPRWKEFLGMIKQELDDLEKIKLPQWKENIITEAHELGLVNDLRHWLEQADEPMPAWAVLAVAVNLKKGGK